MNPPSTEALSKAFRDENLRRLHYTLGPTSALLALWVGIESPRPALFAVVFAVYALGNLAQSHLEIADHPVTRGAHLRGWFNAGLLALLTGLAGPNTWSWVLGAPAVFGGAFALHRTEAVYLQAIAIAGTLTGAWFAGAPEIAGGGLILACIAVMLHRLHVPIRQAYFHMSQQREVADAARTAAQEALAFRSRFLATMAHEIRTPMNGVLGMAQILGRTDLGADQEEMVRTIRGCGDALKQILDDILDLSRLEAGKVNLVDEAYSPSQLVGDVLGLMQHANQHPEVRLVFESAELPQWVRGDPHRVRQVLTNLVSNALKFTPRGAVVVRASSEGDRLRFEVEDTGIGFDDSQLSRLLEPFEQASDHTAANHGGTGLGLAISNRLVIAMGGALTARSTIGAGSLFAFSVRAPISEAPAFADDEVAAAEELSATVLLVDDNAVNLAVGKAMLDKLGCRVVLASGGEEAIACADRADLVLMDYRMPAPDGAETARLLRSRGFTRPILALSASVTEEEHRACMNSGMDGFLAKPLDLSTLDEALRAHLSSA